MMKDNKDAMFFLIEKLAKTTGQARIAEILNSHGLFRAEGRPWYQCTINRYCKSNGIKSNFNWNGWNDEQIAMVANQRALMTKEHSIE